MSAGIQKNNKGLGGMAEQTAARRSFIQLAAAKGADLLGRLANRKETLQATTTSFSTTDLETIRKIFGQGSWTGRTVTDEFAMAVSTVWRCVSLISSTIGALPWAVYEKRGPNDAVEVDDHYLAEVLLYSPNADMDRMQFREAKAANLVLRGNTYSLKETRANGSVSSLYPIPSRIVSVERDNNTLERRYIVLDRGRREVYPAEKIWHVRGFGFDGLIGQSPLGSGRNAIALSSAAEEFGARFFANGARTSAVVKIPQWLEDDQREKAKKNIQEFAGLDNAHKPRLLEGGMEYEEISAKPNEAQHNELRGFQIPDICRFYGVPPHLAFDLSHGSFNNVETLAVEFVMFGLLPHLVRFETSAQRQLLKPGDRRNYFVRFNFEGLLRANTLERAAFLTAMLQNGVMSRNEARAKENLNRIDAPGMDDYTVQSNMTMVNLLEAMVKAGAATGRNNNPQPGAGA